MSLEHHKFRLGEWTVNPEEGVIERQGRSRLLQPKAMELLIYLARHPARVLSKEQLFEAVWPDTAVEEGALTQCVHSLRKALGCNPRNPTYITTLPRRGYRLEAPVELLDVPKSAHPITQPTPSSPRPERAAETARSYSKRYILSVGLSIAIAIVGIALALITWQALNPWHRDPDPPTLVLKPLDVVATPTASVLSQHAADGLRTLIERDLKSAQDLRIGSQQTTRWVTETPLSMDELAENEIDYLLEGSLVDLPDTGLSVEFSLRRTVDDRQLWTTTQNSSTAEIKILARQVSERIRETLGLQRPVQQTSFSDNPEAIAAYLEGLAKVEKGYNGTRINEAAAALEKAVAKDPEFVLAWAELAKAYSWLYFNGQRWHKAAATAALDRALELNPELTEVRLAKAYYHYRVEHDHRLAVEEFQRVSRDRPLDTEVLRGIGHAVSRLGKLRQAIGYLEQAFEQDRLNHSLAGYIAALYRALREHQAADDWYKNSLAIDGDQPLLRGRSSDPRRDRDSLRAPANLCGRSCLGNPRRSRNSSGRTRLFLSPPRPLRYRRSRRSRQTRRLPSSFGALGNHSRRRQERRL